MTTLNSVLTPTWNSLKLNGTDLDLGDLPIAEAQAVSLNVPEAFVSLEPENFDSCWATYEQAARDLSAQRVTLNSTSDVDASLVEQFNADANNPLDIPARNTTPRGAVDYALGDDAVEWLWDNNMSTVYAAVAPYKKIEEPLVIRVHAQDGAAAIVSLDLIACEGSECTVVVEADSPAEGTGVVGVCLRIVAQSNARVEVKQLQTLDTTWTYLETFETKVAENAKVTVEQTYLGGQTNFIGNGHALQGFRSAVDINTAYLASSHSLLDFNYLIRQFGKQTTSNLIANGVLAGTATKNLRGTIDLIHGAKGAVGHELENVLLTNKGTHNRSLPIILCDEDDVHGDHGASIGHVPDDHRHYLQSRGLSNAQIDALFLRSTFEQALVHAYDQSSQLAINRLATKVLGTSLIEE